MTFALFGISNDGLNLAVNLLVFFLVVIWVALVYWTYSDATRRLDDPLLIGCATVASLFPFIGTIVYTIVRPPEYLEDAHERDLEVRAAEKRLALLDNRTCRNCGSEIESNFLRCPTCMRKLKEPCRSCGRPLDPRWRVCPYCEAEVASTRDERGERRRRARRDGDRQTRVTRAADRSPSKPVRGEDPIAEPTPSLTGERRSSQAPPDQ
jgi:RNA polymerase subunit RPABC4/transcription elongation factor Spt4